MQTKQRSVTNPNAARFGSLQSQTNLTSPNPKSVTTPNHGPDIKVPANVNFSAQMNSAKSNTSEKTTPRLAE